MSQPQYKSGLTGSVIETWAEVFARQRAFGEHAIGQLDDAAFFRVAGPGMNPIAGITRHVAGSMKSRFTDFVTTDGEKAWRDREGEFGELEGTSAEREEIMREWCEAWGVLEGALGGLSDGDLGKAVMIRGAPFTVAAALGRALDHYGYHVGQIVTLARLCVPADEWEYFTIRPGGSAAFNDEMRESGGRF